MTTTTLNHPEAIRFENDPESRERDRAAVAALLERPPDQVLVVSDLHVGLGVRPDGDHIASNENFFSDLAFRRLLRFWSRSPDQGPGLLVLLGDIFDFVRHDRPPDHDALDADDLLFWQARLDEIGMRVKVADLQRSISRTERSYGLRTDPMKSVYKVSDTARGHGDFFAGLAEWIGRGGQVLVVRGNHDVEWHWLAVRAAMRMEIRRADPASQVTARQAEAQVLFTDEVGLSLGNIYLEHGHEFEPMTALGDNPPVLRRSPMELTYPLGSFVNRYIINPFEHVDPFLDNVKPVQSAVLALIKKYPLKSLGITIRGWRFLARAFKMGRFGGALTVLGWMILSLLPVLTAGVITAAIAVPGFGDWLVETLGRGAAPAGIGGLAGPYLLAAAQEFLNDYILPRRTIGDKAFHEREAELLALPGPRSYLVLGHTHELHSRIIYREDERVIHFINTGSWTPTWTGQPRDFRADTLHPVVVFHRDRSGYTHAYYEWDDARNGPIPAIMLDHE